MKSIWYLNGAMSWCVTTFFTCILFIICFGSCQRLLGERPEQVVDFPSRHDAAEHGASGNYIFCVYHNAPDELEIWEWSGNTIKKVHGAKFDKQVFWAAIGPDDKWMCSLYDDQIGTDFCVGNLKSGKIISRWRGTGENYAYIGKTSRNRKHVGVYFDDSFEKQIARFGLVAPDGKSFDWIASVDTGDSNDTSGWVMTHNVIPSDNGVYIGVPGWRWGVLMIDVTKKKKLWEKTPKGEAGIYDLAFTPDGKLIYAGGTMGKVYGIKTETGEIVSQWWATLSGHAEYKHKIWSIAISPDGKYVTAGTVPNGLIFLFSTKDGHRWTLRHNKSVGINVLSFSPDSKRLAAYGAGEIDIWKLPQREQPEK